MVAVVGKTPPPIGGVTIHVSRLLRRLEEERVPFVHFDPGSHSWIGLPGVILRSRAVHVHLSNSYLRLLVILLCVALRRRSLLTLHGNLGRWGALRNMFDRLSLRLVDKPIVLNADSFAQTLALNPQTELIGAFIPPPLNSSVPDHTAARVQRWKRDRSPLFCTNAHARVFDKNGVDTYGVEPLLELFATLPKAGLVFSDPSGTYASHFARSGIDIPGNVLIIDRPHSFFEVLRNCDCLIRATTTDGDSISVREALYLGVNVIASDCVTRPSACLLYQTGDNEGLGSLIKSFHRTQLSSPVEDAVPRIIQAYQGLGIGVRG